jgi:quercetin dioxygenase-like cupin family protein
MAQVHAKSGQVVSVAPLQQRLAGAHSNAIIKSEQLELIRCVLHAGKSIHEHQIRGEMTLQCIEGKVELLIGAVKQILVPGDLVLIGRQVPHSLKALADSSLLLTLSIAPAAPAA